MRTDFDEAGRASPSAAGTALASARPGLATALRRALSRRCPNCGAGRLFAAYLKQVDRCAACGEPYAHIRSDDAAPWLTILIVGHIVVALMLVVETYSSFPQWASMLIWPIVAVALALLILPRAKAFLMTIIWFTRAPGSEHESGAS